MKIGIQAAIQAQAEVEKNVTVPRGPKNCLTWRTKCLVTASEVAVLHSKNERALR